MWLESFLVENYDLFITLKETGKIGRVTALVNTHADDLKMTGAKASVAMVLTWLSRNIPITATSGLMFGTMTRWRRKYRYCNKTHICLKRQSYIANHPLYLEMPYHPAVLNFSIPSAGKGLTTKLGVFVF